MQTRTGLLAFGQCAEIVLIALQAAVGEGPALAADTLRTVQIVPL